MFSEARYECAKHSLEKAKRPEQLSFESKIQTLRTFKTSKVQRVSEHFDLSNYPYLPSLTVTRLTLFNYQKGDEPSRMLLTEWQDACNVWLFSEKKEMISDKLRSS